MLQPLWPPMGLYASDGHQRINLVCLVVERTAGVASGTRCVQECSNSRADMRVQPVYADDYTQVRQCHMR